MDPTVTKLQALLAELTTHRDRLNAKATAIRALMQAPETTPERREWLGLIAEAFSEQVDTGLDFQAELIDTIIKELAASPAPDAAEDEAAGDEEGEVEIGIDEEDARVILVALVAYRAMLDAYAPQVKNDAAAAAQMQLRQKECLEAIELVEDMTLVEDAGDGESDDEGDEDEDDAPNGAAPTVTS